MSCCKTKNTELSSGNTAGGVNYIRRIVFFITGVIGFTILLPFLWVGLIYLIFNSTVLNKPSNILPSMSFINNLVLRKNKIDLEEDVDDGEYDEDDYELLNYEEIKE